MEEAIAGRLAEYERLKALGVDKFKDKKWTEAIKYFEQAAAAIYSEGDNDPTRLGYYVICKSNIAQCCMNFDNFKGAIKYSSEALSMDPTNVKALYRRGMSHLKLDEFEEALRDLKSSLELDRGGDVEKVLKKSMDSVNFVNIEGDYLLHAAIKKGHLGIVEFLLSKSLALVHYKNENKCSCLWIASQQGHLPVVEHLLSQGANIHDKDKDNGSCLWVTSQEGHLAVVEHLLSQGANIHDMSINNISCLLIASFNGHLPVVEYLLSQGANIHDKMINNASSLWATSQGGHLAIVEHLLSQGANVHDKNKDNISCLGIAAHEGHLEVMKLLLSQGASVYDRANHGDNCLAMATTQEGQYLLENWVVTMLLIVLQELYVLSSLDPSLFLDLRTFMG